MEEKREVWAKGREEERTTRESVLNEIEREMASVAAKVDGWASGWRSVSVLDAAFEVKVEESREKEAKETDGGDRGRVHETTTPDRVTYAISRSGTCVPQTVNGRRA